MDQETAPPVEGRDLAPPRAPAPWTRVLKVGLAGFALWLLLFAPTLQHNAKVSPVGTRRSVALDILGPIAAVSRGLQLSHIVSETDALTGRTGNRPGNGSAFSVLGPHQHPTRPPSVGGQPNGPPSTTVPANVTHPTAAHPLRVLIVGDGPLRSRLEATR